MQSLQSSWLYACVKKCLIHHSLSAEANQSINQGKIMLEAKPAFFSEFIQAFVQKLLDVYDFMP